MVLATEARMRQLLVVLLVAVVQAAVRTGLKCYSNGDGVEQPSLVPKEIYCQPDEWCVAENHYGSTAAALWPLDVMGEKCYRMCKKVSTDSTWNSEYQDAEETIRVYSRDNSDKLTMTCYQDLCNEHCLDEDSAAGLGPSLTVLVISICIALLVPAGAR